MTSVKIEDSKLENVRVIADFGSESEDEHECDRKTIERENTEKMNYIKSHPMPSPNEDNETITSPFKEHSEVRGLIGYAYLRFDIIRKMY